MFPLISKNIGLSHSEIDDQIWLYPCFTPWNGQEMAYRKSETALNLRKMDEMSTL